MANPNTIGIYVRVSRKGDREDERFHSPREQAERATALVRRVTKAGGVLLTPDIPEAIDSPTGEFTFGMLLQVAKLYRSTAGARFASAKERAIKAGIPVGSIPFGYRQRPDRRLEVDPAKAPVVRELFDRWARGEGRGSLAAFLDEATKNDPPRARTRGGRERTTWSREAVPQMIRNRIYATGRMTYGDLVSQWDAGAIVDEALWHAAQRPQSRRPPRSDAGWLLTGLARCASCHGTLKVSSHTSKYGTYRNYKCRNRACPSRVSVSAARLEPWVVSRSMALGDELETRSEAPDLGPLEDALAAATRRLEQVMAPGVADELGELWAPEVGRRRRARDEAAAALGEARATAGVGASQPLHLSGPHAKVGQLRAYNARSISRRRCGG